MPPKSRNSATKAFYYHPDAVYIFVTCTNREDLESAVDYFCFVCGPHFDISNVTHVTCKPEFRDHYLLRVPSFSVARMCVDKLKWNHARAKIITPEDASITLSRERTNLPVFSRGSTRELAPGLDFFELASPKRISESGKLEAFLGKCRVFIIQTMGETKDAHESLAIVAVHPTHARSIQFMASNWRFLGSRFTLRHLHPMEALLAVYKVFKGIIPSAVWLDAHDYEKAYHDEKAAASEAKKKYFEELATLGHGGEAAEAQGPELPSLQEAMAGMHVQPVEEEREDEEDKEDKEDEEEIDDFVRLLLQHDPGNPGVVEAEPVYVDCAVNVAGMFRQTKFKGRSPFSFKEFMKLLAPQCPEYMCIIEILDNPKSWKTVRVSKTFYNILFL